MTDKELVDKAHELAVRLLAVMGYHYDTTSPRKLYSEETSSRGNMAWEMACEAYDFIRGSDVRNALAEVEGDAEAEEEARRIKFRCIRTGKFVEAPDGSEYLVGKDGRVSLSTPAPEGGYQVVVAAPTIVPMYVVGYLD